VSLFWLFGKHDFVAGELAAAGLFKHLQQLFDGKLFLFFALYINHDLPFMHHDEAVAHTDGICHIVCDHDRDEVIPGDDLLPAGFRDPGTGKRGNALFPGHLRHTHGYLETAHLSQKQVVVQKPQNLY